jgi:hypothetical protein
MIRKLAVVAWFGAITALAADEALPKAETILDRFIEVTGGANAYQKRKTETVTGTVEFGAQGLKGTLTRYAADPDNNYSMIELEGIGKIEAGARSGVAWEMSPILGPRVKSGEEKAQTLREGTFNAELHWRKLYPTVETAGVEMVDGEDCYKVVLTPAEGKTVTTYFQKKSGLAVKITTVAVTQMGEIPLEVIMSDYKDFAGVRVPTRHTERVAGQEMTMTIQSVQVNGEIPADRFDPPAEIKALLNKAAAPAVKK